MIELPDYLDNSLALEPRNQFDNCIIGYIEIHGKYVLLYDYIKVIESLMSVQQMSYDEAVDYFYYNMNTGQVVYRHEI